MISGNTSKASRSVVQAAMVAGLATTSSLSGTDSGLWVISGVPTTITLTNLVTTLLPLLASLTPTGVVVPYPGTTAPSGWVILQGGTMGNGASGGTARANADTEDLFALLWDSISNTYAPVSGGRGANAAADYAANKTITLPDFRGRSPIGTGQGNTAEGGGAGTTRINGSTGGAETHTLVTAEIPSHAHSKGTTSTAGGGAPAAGQGTGADTTGSTGGGGDHNNMHPWLSLNFIIKL